jgi:uncharacterized protein (TIGR02118 family)
MIKVFALLPRRADVSAEYFHDHWRTVHAYHALRISSLRRYVQSHRIGVDVPGLEAAPFEGVAEVWYDDAAAAVGQNDDPDYTEYAKRDEPSFIAVDRLRHVMTNDRVFAGDVRPGGRETVKALIFLKRSAGSTPADFGRALGAVCERSAAGLVGVERVADAVALADEYQGREPAYDGFAEFAWPDVPSFLQGWDASGAELLDHLSQLSDTELTQALLVSENPVLVG